MYKLLFVRRVVGRSMEPRLMPGSLVWATAVGKNKLRPGQVVIVAHQGREKIKRIERINPEGQLFVVGDNLELSTDSRQFGWLDRAAVLGVVIRPQLHN